MADRKVVREERRETHRDYLRQFANRERAVADETADQWGCDDPLFPFMPLGAEQQFRDWLDFVERVARPLVEAEDEEATQAAMRLYRKASPYFICVSLVLAAAAADRSGADGD